MKAYNIKAIVELLDKRGSLQQFRNSLATSETITVGDDPKKQIELPVAGLLQNVRDVIDSELVAIDLSLAELGVKME